MNKECQLTVGTGLQQVDCVLTARPIDSEVSETHQTTTTATISNLCSILKINVR